MCNVTTISNSSCERKSVSRIPPPPVVPSVTAPNPPTKTQAPIQTPIVEDGLPTSTATLSSHMNEVLSVDM